MKHGHFVLAHGMLVMFAATVGFTTGRGLYGAACFFAGAFLLWMVEGLCVTIRDR